MSNSNEYHGQQWQSMTAEAPPMPAHLRDAPVPHEIQKQQMPEADAAPMRGTPGGISIYPRVHFEGRYGLGCIAHQEFIQTNLSWEQVKKTAWDAFGMYPKTVTVFDHQGNMVYRGSL